MLQGSTSNAPSSSEMMEGGEKAVSSANNDDDTATASPTGSFTLNGFNACSAGLLAEDDPRPNWETLQAIEARRRSLLVQVELPVYRILVNTTQNKKTWCSWDVVVVIVVISPSFYYVVHFFFLSFSF